MLFRREVYWQVGAADENLVYSGDWKAWASMALTGGMVSHVEEVLNYCRFHAGSVTTRSQRNGVEAVKFLHVVGWILQRVDLSPTDRTKRCNELSRLWVPAVLNRRLGIKMRWTILRNARAIDQHALRKLPRPALTALRLTLVRRLRSLRAGSPVPR